MGDAEARRTELTLAEHVRLLDDLAAAGSLWLCYTGGEIFARPDFLEIYRAARERGFIVTLFTNATLVTERVADALAELPPFSIEVTLYGATRATYEALTGIPGSYEKCLRGIRLLGERNLPLALKTVAVTINRHELEAMKGLAAELGLPFKWDAMMSPRLDCSKAPLEVRLSPEEIVALDLEDAGRMAEWERFRGSCSIGIPPEPSGAESLYQCGGAVTSFAVDPQGRMSVCVLSEDRKYDLRTGSLRDGWEVFLHSIRSLKRTRPSRCARCGLQSLCGMCPANGFLENGDPEKPVEFLCETAHLRAAAFGWETPEHGPCAYCHGGADAERLAAQGAALREGREAPSAPTRVFLPTLSSRAGETGACGR
jgi:radical SAM protein with 4Fe4S-binding SPASM domain